MVFKNKKIKILYIHPKLTFGGAEAQRLTLLKNWNLPGYEISILCIEEIGEIGAQIKKLGIPVYCLDQSSHPCNLKATFMLLLFLLRHRFDIVQTCLFNANFHGRIAAFLARIPYIFSEEHSEHYMYNSRKFIPYILMDKLLSIATKKIICCCKTLEKDIMKLEGIRPDRLTTILSTVDLDKLNPVMAPNEVRTQLKLADSDFIIGNVGSMSPRKGHEYLLQAFSLVKKKIPNTRLILIGQEDKTIKANLQRLANKFNISDSIYFLGKVKECANYYNIMDVFVLSSVSEGIPLVILEAMKMGVPVVSMEVGGISEMITHNQTGLLVAPQDVLGLSENITDLLLNKEKRVKLAAAAKERVLSRFKPDRYIKELADLYSTALN